LNPDGRCRGHGGAGKNNDVIRGYREERRLRGHYFKKPVRAYGVGKSKSTEGVGGRFLGAQRSDSRSRGGESARDGATARYRVGL